MTYITEVIRDDYKNWRMDETICITSGTGSGKTTFIIEVLGKYAEERQKSILYLCNRSQLRTQVSKKVFNAGLYGRIRVETYQHVQQLIEQDAFDYTLYDYLVCDEYHYFVTDASFNEGTADLYHFIRNITGKCIIYMSATISLEDIVPDHIYSLPVDYSYIHAVKVYNVRARFDIIDNILQQDDTSKILVFGNQKLLKDAYERYQEIADFIGSKSMCRKLHFCKSPQEIIQDGTFKKGLLFATRVIDNGTDLTDKNLKYIMIEMTDPQEIIQCIGRRRVKEADDICTIYIRQYKCNEVQGIINRVESQLNAASMYLHNRQTFNQIYLTQTNNRKALRRNECFFYKADSIGFNSLRYKHYRKYHQVLVNMKEDGFTEALSRYLPAELVAKIEPDDTQPLQAEADELKKYLYSKVGQKLFKAEQTDLKDRFKTVGLNVTKIGTPNKRPTGIKTINALLDERYGDSFAYRLYNADPVTGQSYRDMKRYLPDGTDNPNRDKRYWMLQ